MIYYLLFDTQPVVIIPNTEGVEVQPQSILHSFFTLAQIPYAHGGFGHTTRRIKVELKSSS